MKLLKKIIVTTDQLLPNPKNPRRSVGDITELTASVKQNGILQELSVVPHGTNDTADGFKDAYMVVIGHRRLAAAKAAGIEHVPVSVYEMTEQEMQSVMLTENMQRSDLTTYEEARGIQMCLDLGMTDAEVAHQTGLSKTTVKNRTVVLKYADAEDKLNSGTVKLQNYLDIEKIKDEDTRKELIKYLGTNNFDWRMACAEKDQTKKERIDKLIEYLKENGAVEFAEDETINETDMQMIYSVDSWQYQNITNPDLIEGKQYKYINDSDGIEVYLMEPPEETEEEEVEDEKTDLLYGRSENKQKIIDAFKVAYSLRYAFIKELFEDEKLESRIEKKWVDERTIEFIVKGTDNECEFLDALLGFESHIENEVYVYSPTERFIKFYQENKTKTIVALYLNQLESYSNYHDALIDYDGHYNADDKDVLVELYAFLKTLGYKISDQEESLVEGTSDLYVKDE